MALIRKQLTPFAGIEFIRHTSSLDWMNGDHQDGSTAFDGPPCAMCIFYLVATSAHARPCTSISQFASVARTLALSATAGRLGTLHQVAVASKSPSDVCRTILPHRIIQGCRTECSTA